MMSKRMPLALTLGAVLFVTAGFGATKKFHRNDGSRDWKDLSLQNGRLPDASRSLSNGSSGFRSSGASRISSSYLILDSPSIPDNWLGGTGNWSNGADWSAGEPGPMSGVNINTGSDNVILDTGSSINSLNLGGATGSSILTGDGNRHTLTIAGALTVNQSGSLNLSADTVTAGADSSNAGSISLSNGSSLTITGSLTNSGSFSVSGSGDSASMRTLTNTGSVAVGTGATLNLTNQPGGITDVVAGSSYNIAGSFTAGANSAFMNLTSIEGQVVLQGQIDTITPNGGTLTIAGTADGLAIGGGSTVSITGNLTNNDYLTTNEFVSGSNDRLNISGTLTNNGAFYLLGSGDVANLGTLANNGSGTVLLENGARLTTAGNVTNSGSMNTEGGTINITDSLTNSGSFSLSGSGDSASMQTLSNTGSVFVGTGATLNLTNQPGGITDVVAGSSYNIAGSFTAGANSAFMNLTSIEGQVVLQGQIDTITPNGGTLTIAGTADGLAIGGGSTVSITGNLTNNDYLTTNEFVSGSNDRLNISGTLTNNGAFYLLGSGDVANLGTLANNGSGTVLLENGARLTTAGNVTNSGSMNTEGGTINITDSLTNSGSFSLSGSGDSASMQTLSNTGSVFVGTGATLNLTNQPGGITDVVAGSSYNIAGSFTAGANSAFMNLTSIEGQVVLQGQIDTITPNGGTLTIAGTADGLAIGGGSTVSITGNLTNNDYLTTNEFVSGSNDRLNISGTLTNNGAFYLLGSGDVANLGTLANNGSGTVLLENGARLTTAGNVTNSGSMNTEGGTINITDSLTNSGSFSLSGSGDSASMQTLSNTGSVFVGTGATLNLTNQPGGITDVVAGSSYNIAGSFTAGANSAFMNLTSIEGQVVLQGQIDTITPNGGTLTIAGTADGLAIGGGSTVSITGNLTNNDYLTTNEFVSGSNDRLNISGTLTNNGAFYLLGSGDVANLGTLANNGSGTVLLENGARLTTAGNVTNSGSMNTEGGTINITDSLTNSGSFSLSGSGDSASMQTLSNTGSVFVGTGATLNLTNQPGGITDVVAGSSYNIAGSFTAGANSAFMNLTSIEGQVVLQGQIDTITPNGGTLTIAGTADGLAIGGGSTVSITGNLTNNDYLTTNEFVSGSNDRLNISGTLTNNGAFYLLGSGDVANLGTLANNGSGTVLLENGARLTTAGNVTNSGSMNTEGGTINITGKLTNTAGGTFSLGAASDLASVGHIMNAGSISVASSAILSVSGASAAAPTSALPGFVNTGIVNIASGGTLSIGLPYVQTSGQTTVDGTLRASARVAVVNFAGGSVYGNDTIQAPTIMSNAAINIGDGPMTVGQMSFMGNYTQQANGSLTFDIAGAAAGQYDQLNVSGHATLNGLINVDLLGGFVPQIGNMFDIINYSSVSGTFSNGPNLPIDSQEHFHIEYNSTTLILDVVSGTLSGTDTGSGDWFGKSAAADDRASAIASAIAPLDGLAPVTIASAIAPHNSLASTTPEPSSFLLLGTGLLCLGYSIRRRMTK